MKRKLFLLILFVASTLLLFLAMTFAVSASDRVVINVLSQPRREWELLEQYLPEFEERENIDVVIHYFAELERRSRSRLDAATGAGLYQVYYIDEANVAEFAANGWLVPIRDYYPAEYDFEGFSQPLVNVLSYDGVAYGAPMTFEGEIMFYRKDLFEADGIAVPETLDDYLEVVKHFHNPPDLYGTATRGLRGSGMNVWRFSPYLRRFEGRYLDEDGNPVFNSPEAVQAVEYYIELIKHSPSPTMSWSDVMDAFAAGKIAIASFANLKMDYLMDPEESVVVDKMGYAPPAAGPKGRVSNTSTHGLAISSPGCRTEEERVAAGKFIGWFTSKENEIRKVLAGSGLTNARTSTFASPEFAAAYPAEFIEAQLAMMEAQELTIPQIPQWPEIGDYLGLKLEELFAKAYVGEPYDIQAALDDAVRYAQEVLAEE
ncbi:MAG TPA: sugar ABC transporter substrate-binding protein [Atribacteraceae bacterium]|nr:sugar ABC transporter substrate-binding protein [Atribacteraceae bacterium]